MAKVPTKEQGDSGAVSFGGVLSPTSIDYAAKWAAPERWKTIEKMRADPAVTAALAAITQPILKAPLLIEPADPDDEDSVRIADFIRDDLEHMTIDLASHRLESLDSVGDGVSVFETVFEKRGDGLIHLRKLARRPNRTISEWLVDEEGNGGPLGVTQLKADGTATELLMDRLLVFSHLRGGGHLMGRPALRAMYKPWLLIDQLSRIGAISAERGAGVPVAKYKGKDDTKRRKLEDALASLHANERSYLVIDEDVLEFKFEGPAGKQFDTVPLLEYHRRDLLLATLTQFLALGMDGVGSMALSRDHSDLFLLMVQHVAGEIEGTYNRYLIPRWVGYNWTVDKSKLPKVSHGPIGQKSVKDWVEAISIASAAGIKLDPDEVSRTTSDLLGLAPPAPPEDAPASEGDPIEPTMLNGIQIQSALDIMERFAQGSLSYTQAKTTLVGFLAIGANLIPLLLGREGEEAPPAPSDSALEESGLADGLPMEADEFARRLTTARLITAGPIQFSKDGLKSPGVLADFGVAPDFAAMSTELDGAEERIAKRLERLQSKQVRRLASHAKRIIKAGDPAAVADFEIEWAEEAEAIEEELLALRDFGIEQATAELEQQGIEPKAPDAAQLAADAVLLAASAAEAARALADRMRTAWGETVIRQMGEGNGFNAKDYAETVTPAGEKLAATKAREVSSSGLGAGRSAVATANAGKIKREVYSAFMDANTCRGDRTRCFENDGLEYPVGKGTPAPNPNCKGRRRCRCIRIAITAEDSIDDIRRAHGRPVDVPRSGGLPATPDQV